MIQDFSRELQRPKAQVVRPKATSITQGKGTDKGLAGAYVSALDPEHRDRLRSRCRQLLPIGSFAVDATTWAALARP
jgi:hypothetical protein